MYAQLTLTCALCLMSQSHMSHCPCFNLDC